MAAAFWLTSTAALRERFDVTVYTRGWRLGGKGASGRNAKYADRIEEHGLHMWMGCYENAFRTIRACYDEWRPRASNPFRSWTDAFSPQFRITFTQRDGGPLGNEWGTWHFVLSKRRGTPGDGEPLLWADRVLHLAGWLASRLRDSSEGGGEPPGVPRVRARLVQRIAAWSVLTAIRLATLFLLLVRLLLGVVTRIIRAFAKIRPITRYSILADLGLTMLIGIARDILPFGVAGFDRINDYDFRAWLTHHGALRPTVQSAPVRALYDLGFAYPGGDASSFSNGRGATGAALRFLLELGLAYKGAPLWKMNAGMGDAVFAPLYQVLVARGVDFKFFHQVARLDVSADERSISAIVVRRQAELRTGRYDPLVAVGGLDCWPSEPLWDQLVDGEKLSADGADFESIWGAPNAGEQTLKAGVDFDIALLAFPPEMIRIVGSALSDHSDEWKQMIEHSASVATQAFQLWLRPALADLGWKAGPTVLSAYAEPFDSWADMSHLLPHEHWTGADVPRTIAYFCGAMPTPLSLAANPPGLAMQDVKRNAETWLVDHGSFIWPARLRRGAKPAPGLVISSYFRGNVDPSERYVQTLPGSVRYRLAPASGTYSNLYLAGDWTRTRYSAGSVEAAVESGMLAAQAIGGEPVRIYGH
jgi:uncharacterized protein with NAD-binding domain and iron-sulfur cluster